MSAKDDGTAPKTGGGNLDASAATAVSTRAVDVTSHSAGVSGSAAGSAAGGVYSAGGDGSGVQGLANGQHAGSQLIRPYDAGRGFFSVAGRRSAVMWMELSPSSKN